MRLGIALLLGLLAGCPSLAAQSCDGLIISGYVSDVNTKARVAGATVSAVGDIACTSVRTDDKGFFQLQLLRTVAQGTSIRIAVAKTGYRPYDEHQVVPLDQPFDIYITASPSVRVKKTAPEKTPIAAVVTPENVKTYIHTWLKDKPLILVNDAPPPYPSNSLFAQVIPNAIFALALTDSITGESVLVHQSPENNRFIEISSLLMLSSESEEKLANLSDEEIKDIEDDVFMEMDKERMETYYARTPLQIFIFERIRIEPMTEETFGSCVSDVMHAGKVARDMFYRELEKARKSQLPPANPKVSRQDLMDNGSSTTAFAPNGIAITGGNVQNPTVNNYGTPLPTLSFTEELVPDRPVPTLRVHVRTDRAAQGLIVGARFSDEVQTVGPAANSNDPDYPKLIGANSQQLAWGGPLVEQDGTKIPYSLGFLVEIPAYVLPEMELVFTVTSKVPVHVLDLGAIRTGAPSKPQ